MPTNPRPDPPSSSSTPLLPGIAGHLPFHVLLAIFAAARDLDRHRFDHGGDIVAWDSNESIAPLALVSRCWSDAANFLLYRSVAILGGKTAEVFLRTVRTRPERASLVKALVVGRNDDAEDDEMMDVGEESAILVEVIEACPSVENLHVWPLHASARVLLLSAIDSRRQLKALVCLPRQELPGGPLFHPIDILALATPTVERLELDFATTPTPLPSSLPISATLSLTHLRAFCDAACDVIFHLIASAGPTLLSLDLYFEAAHDPRIASTSLLPCTATLQRLSYLANPPNPDLAQPTLFDPPLLDLLLPHFRVLADLAVSATDISPGALRRLPPSLKRLEVHSLRSFSRFGVAEDVLEVLREQSQMMGLEAFEIRGEEWSEEQVERVREAFRRRGVQFQSLVECGREMLL